MEPQTAVFLFKLVLFIGIGLIGRAIYIAANHGQLPDDTGCDKFGRPTTTFKQEQD